MRRGRAGGNCNLARWLRETSYTLAARMNTVKYDLFISHASEDKEDVVRPLAQRLTELAVSVWYDEFVLRLGDSLSEAIDCGLAQSRFGAVVISKAFMHKAWTKRELRGLVAREVQEGKVILPIWHTVSSREVTSFSPTLADLFAIDTSMGIQAVADKIVQIINPNVEANTLERARQLLANGDINAAIVSAVTILEERLREIAVDRLSYSYFKKRPIRYYNLRNLVQLNKTKRYLRSRKIAEIDYDFIIRTRNSAAHSSSGVAFEDGRRVLTEIERIFAEIDG